MATAGATFGIAALGSTIAQAQSEATIIDTHFHIFPPSVVELQRRNPGWANTTPPRKPEETTPARMIADIGQKNLAGVVASPPTPGAWYGDREASRMIQRAFNEYAAQFSRDNPKRVGFLAMIALPDIEGALKEIAYAYDVLGADGVGIYSSYDGKYPGDPAFAPVLEELDRRKAIVLIHPNNPNCCGAVLPGVAPSLIEYAFDLTRSVASLVSSGAAMKFPNIRFIVPQGGGAFPLLAERLEEAGKAALKGQSDAAHQAQAALKRFYVDVSGATNHYALHATLQFVDKSQIMFGSDYPYGSGGQNYEGFAKADLDPSLRRAIASDNARKLFRRFGE